MLTRSVRDTAAFYREAERIWRNPKLAPIGPYGARWAAAADCRADPLGATRVRPRIAELTLKSAGLLEGLGRRVEMVEEPPAPARFVDDFVLYWGFLAFAQVSWPARIRPDVRQDSARQPDPGPGSSHQPQPAPASARDCAAAQAASAQRTVLEHL